MKLCSIEVSEGFKKPPMRQKLTRHPRGRNIFKDSKDEARHPARKHELGHNVQKAFSSIVFYKEVQQCGNDHGNTSCYQDVDRLTLE